MLDLDKSWSQLVKNNDQISHGFMIYQLFMSLTSIVSPAIVLILITESLNSVFKIGAWNSFLIVSGSVVIFTIICFKCEQGI